MHALLLALSLAYPASPQCSGGTAWVSYQSDPPAMLLQATCEGCKAVCDKVGTKSEGWYSSCDGSLIQWADCSPDEPVACTMDAKLCPDGVTYVGRERPDCLFAACPDVKKADCAPYLCPDGTAVDTCSEDGTRLAFYDSPCKQYDGYVPERSFSDVSVGSPNREAIEYVKQQGIVEGYEDGTYRPDSTINRAEFVKILMGSFEDDGRMCKIAAFSDVDQSAWYATYAHRARCQGIVEGYPDGSFKPAASINFVEAAKILSNAYGLLASTTIPACEGDCPWYRDYVLMLEMRGAIPTSITSFDQPITRGEMAEMIWRLMAGNNDKPSKTYEELSGVDIEYVVRYNYESDQSSSDPYDGVILARNVQTGKETILVSSIKKALPELSATVNLTLRVFAQFDDSDVVIFKSVLMDTDNSSGKLYSFDLSSKTFSKMKLSDAFDGFYDGSHPSPDGRHIVWTSQPDLEKAQSGLVQTLNVASFADDSYRVVVTLQGSETFNGGQFAMSSIFDITWIDNATVRYAVYDQNEKYGDPIAYRTVTVR